MRPACQQDSDTTELSSTKSSSSTGSISTTTSSSEKSNFPTKKPSLSSTSSTTSTISSSSESTSALNSTTSKIPEHYNTVQHVSSQKEPNEPGVLLETLKNEMEQQLVLMQWLRSHVESQQNFFQTPKNSKESLLTSIQILEDLMAPLLSLIQALEYGVKLRLTWVQWVKVSMYLLSSTIQTHKGGVAPLVLTLMIREVVESLSFTIQELNNLMKSLQILAEGPKGPMGPEQIPVQTSEALEEISRASLPHLKHATEMQLDSDRTLMNAMKSQLYSNPIPMHIRETPCSINTLNIQFYLTQIFNDAINILNSAPVFKSAMETQLDPIRILMIATTTHFCLIQILKN